MSLYKKYSIVNYPVIQYFVLCWDSAPSAHPPPLPPNTQTHVHMYVHGQMEVYVSQLSPGEIDEKRNYLGSPSLFNENLSI